MDFVSNFLRADLLLSDIARIRGSSYRYFIGYHKFFFFSITKWKWAWSHMMTTRHSSHPLLNKHKRNLHSLERIVLTRWSCQISHMSRLSSIWHLDMTLFSSFRKREDWDMSSTRSENSWHKRIRVMNFSCKSLHCAFDSSQYRYTSAWRWRDPWNGTDASWSRRSSSSGHLGRADLHCVLGKSSTRTRLPPDNVKEFTKTIKFDDSHNFPSIVDEFGTVHQDTALNRWRRTRLLHHFFPLSRTQLFSTIFLLSQNTQWSEKNSFHHLFAFQSTSG